MPATFKLKNKSNKHRRATETALQNIYGGISPLNYFSNLKLIYETVQPVLKDLKNICRN